MSERGRTYLVDVAVVISCWRLHSNSGWDEKMVIVG